MCVSTDGVVHLGALLWFVRGFAIVNNTLVTKNKSRADECFLGLMGNAFVIILCVFILKLELLVLCPYN